MNSKEQFDLSSLKNLNTTQLQILKDAVTEELLHHAVNKIDKPTNWSGILISIEEFQMGVKTGCFTEYDGIGYWATTKTTSNYTYWDGPHPPSKMKDVGFTHIRWYNK